MKGIPSIQVCQRSGGGGKGAPARPWGQQKDSHNSYPHQPQGSEGVGGAQDGRAQVPTQADLAQDAPLSSEEGEKPEKGEDQSQGPQLSVPAPEEAGNMPPPHHPPQRHQHRQH